MRDMFRGKDKLKKIMKGGYCEFWQYPKGAILTGEQFLAMKNNYEIKK